MKFKIGDKTYDVQDLDLLSIKDHLLFEMQTTKLGRHVRLDQVIDMSAALSKLTMKDRSAHPDNLWVLAATIWGSRRLAGEDLTFGDAIDFPTRDLEILPDPAVEEPTVNPTKPRPRKGSGVAGKNRAKAPAHAETPTSEPASTDA